MVTGMPYGIQQQMMQKVEKRKISDMVDFIFILLFYKFTGLCN
jgi:hypothetical protein